MDATLPIEVLDLLKQYRGSVRPALDEVSLEVHQGEVVGLVGLNGAGKTTLLRTIAGLLRPNSGTVKVCGNDIRTQKVQASLPLGFVPEFPAYNPTERILAILRFHAGYYGWDDEEARSRSLSLLRTVGLDSDPRLRYRALSQGMQKRFALAAALLGDPQVLLLDEILNGLDTEGLLVVRKLIRDLRGRGGAILLSSHVLPEIQALCDWIAILDRGVLVRVVDRAELTSGRIETLRITLADNPTSAVEFLRTFGRTEQIEGEILVYHPSSSPEEINAALLKAGFRVRSLGWETVSLQDVFHETLGLKP